MNNKVIDITFFWYFFDKSMGKLIAIELINTQSAFYCTWGSLDSLSNWFHAIENKIWLFHQARSKRALLYSWTWASNI